MSEEKKPTFCVVQEVQVPGIPGASGATFFPEVSRKGIISWTNTHGYENPEPIDIAGVIVDLTAQNVVDSTNAKDAAEKAQRMAEAAQGKAETAQSMAETAQHTTEAKLQTFDTVTLPSAVATVKAQETASVNVVLGQETASVNVVLGQETASVNVLLAQQASSEGVLQAQETTSVGVVKAQEADSVAVVLAQQASSEGVLQAQETTSVGVVHNQEVASVAEVARVGDEKIAYATAQANNAATEAQNALSQAQNAAASASAASVSEAHALDSETKAKASEVNAKASEDASAVSEEHARIAAEGTDEEAATLGMLHSAKGWAGASAAGQVNADWRETDPASKAFIFGKEKVDEMLGEVVAKVKEIELFKFPNATIIGTPMIQQGQVSGFSTENYLMFPFLVDFKGFPFRIEYSMTTGLDVTTQQNVFDSEFGMALAILDGRFTMAISVDGAAWATAQSGTYTVEPETTYFCKVEWDGAVYKLSVSLDGSEYVEDIVYANSSQPYPKQIFIGGVNELFGQPGHPFGGTLNLNQAHLYIGNMTTAVWSGMDSAGMATRADVSLENIDTAGEEKIRAVMDLVEVTDEEIDAMEL